MADSIRGDGLFMADAALAALLRDPVQLDLARDRFSQPPPSYRSRPSGTPTRSQSPDPPGPEEESPRCRRDQVFYERTRSYPSSQFESQIVEEAKRIDKAKRGNVAGLGYLAYRQLARKKVKKRWVDQGIWNGSGVKFSPGPWKHQVPLEPESESETATESEPEPEPAPEHRSIFGLPPKPKPKRRRPKSDEEKQRIAERLVVRKREREATRPFHQFVYQVSKERGRIHREMRVDGGPGSDPTDISTTAYENVKNKWLKRGIWNNVWGILPGMSWKHEQDFEECFAEQESGVAAPPPIREGDENEEESEDESEDESENDQPPRPLPPVPAPPAAGGSMFGPSAFGNGAGGAPQPPVHRGVGLFGDYDSDEPSHAQASDVQDPPRGDPPDEALPTIPELDDGRSEAESTPPGRTRGDLSPVESEQSQSPGVPGAFPEELSTAVETPARIPNGHTSPSPPARIPRRRGQGHQGAPSEAGSTPRQRGGGSPDGGRPGGPGTRTALSPVRPAKVTKPAAKRGPGRPRKSRASGEPPSNDAEPSTSAPGASEPPPVTPRRSKRLQEVKLSPKAGPPGTSPANPVNGAARPKPRRSTGGRKKDASPAKPAGVSKRRTRGSGR